MNIDDLIASMTPEIYQNMRDAVQLGRWGDGRAMTPEQKTHSLEALIRYEHMHDIPEKERVGYVDTSKKNKKSGPSDTQPLKIIE
ncbi:DUF1315 family protein [Bermanella marisrubri]|uniref:DUF1315 domain-containing protein n=1 Tax=Bermanella marisrubri TaxID=207949 RepID=Q1N0L5_9GAMM|nr:DUF1315 family protein [Bermanella marisrubri]EAT11818.1 hypothetical protein RED65_05509 [Oceanobacter sp. RED65] [Bermanella marisrubri]QIZ83852.1 DUF1315 family protein [Bermanella marisrubri]